MKINIVRLGIVPYDRALDIQRRLLERRTGEIDNTLLLLEHPPVLTLGTRGDPANIYLTLENSSRGGVFKVERGGMSPITGRGICGYPIIDLKSIAATSGACPNISVLYRPARPEYGIAAH